MSDSLKPTEPASEAIASEVGLLAGWGRWLGALLDRPMPDYIHADPDRARRARLIARFGMVGSFFGIVYATFYLLIGHEWGTVVILFCSSCFAITPWLMRRSRSIEPAGNFLVLILTLGFTALCFMEGGLHGHAIAWLVSVPLCALLLVGQRAAKWWAAGAMLAAAFVASFALAGINLPLAYDRKWDSIVSCAGYLGLILFMFLLGWIFESGRARAFAKMQLALKDLAVSNDRLVHVNKEKNDFLGIVAHDLKNPLTAILGGVEMLAMSPDKERLGKLANMIGGSAIRMRTLITDLLDANAIEQGKFASKMEPCDVKGMVDQSVEQNQSAATRKGIEIRVGVTEGLCAKADRAATMQILDNLISNAVKYSPPKTTVHVHTLPEKEFVVIAVRDEGPGISEDDQKKMFQKYTRLTARPTAGESSTGLGLSIVKKLAEAMAGSVHCYSVLGGGATFTLRLPRTNELPVVAEVPIATPKPQMVLPEPPSRVFIRN